MAVWCKWAPSPFVLPSLFPHPKSLPPRRPRRGREGGSVIELGELLAWLVLSLMVLPNWFQPTVAGMTSPPFPEKRQPFCPSCWCSVSMLGAGGDGAKAVSFLFFYLRFLGTLLRSPADPHWPILQHSRCRVQSNPHRGRPGGHKGREGGSPTPQQQERKQKQNQPCLARSLLDDWKGG